MTKQKHLNRLAIIAFSIDEKMELSSQRTIKLRRMATMAREGMKESEEFKALKREFKTPKVIDYSDDMTALRKVVKQLRKYKFND